MILKWKCLLWYPNQVQRHLQIRIEAQSKYLQSILDKACKALDDQAVASAGLEAARKELSELAIKVANDCNGILSVTPVSHNDSDTDKNSIPYLPARLGECSMDSGVISNGTPISPSTLESQAAALKKRPRPLFSAGESMPLDSSMRPVEWMMSNFGWNEFKNEQGFVCVWTISCLYIVQEDHRKQLL